MRFVCVVIRFIREPFGVDIEVSTGSIDDSDEKIPTTDEVSTGLETYCQQNRTNCDTFTGPNRNFTDLVTVNGKSLPYFLHNYQ